MDKFDRDQLFELAKASVVEEITEFVEEYDGNPESIEKAKAATNLHELGMAAQGNSWDIETFVDRVFHAVGFNTSDRVPYHRGWDT